MAYSWQLLQRGVPFDVSMIRYCELNGELYALGGWGNCVCGGKLYKWDAALSQWLEVAPALGSPVYWGDYRSLFVHDGYIYSVTSGSHLMRSNGGEWEAVEPAGRSCQGAMSFGGLIYLADSTSGSWGDTTITLCTWDGTLPAVWNTVGTYATVGKPFAFCVVGDTLYISSQRLGSIDPLYACSLSGEITTVLNTSAIAAMCAYQGELYVTELSYDDDWNEIGTLGKLEGDHITTLASFTPTPGDNGDLSLMVQGDLLVCYDINFYSDSPTRMFAWDGATLDPDPFPPHPYPEYAAAADWDWYEGGLVSFGGELYGMCSYNYTQGIQNFVRDFLVYRDDAPPASSGQPLLLKWQGRDNRNRIRR